MLGTVLERLRRKVERLRREISRPKPPPPHPTLEAIRADPANVMALAGMPPDRWQQEVLRSSLKRTLLLCSRQAGKSQTAAAVALREALLRPGSLILLFSPTLRQSGELFRDKVLRLYTALGRPVAASRETALQLDLANGSRILSLPGDEGNVRGYSSARLIVVDEASRVPDPLYFALRPMLAVSRGSLLALSTPYGKIGWFYDEWHKPIGWHRVKITANQCPRITPEFLAEELKALGPRWYGMEYNCEFADVIDAVFAQADIDAAMSDELAPLPMGDE